VDKEKLEAFELGEAGRQQKSRAGNSGVAGVAAHGEAQMIGVSEAVTEIAGKTAIEESIVASLAVALEVRAGERVVECVEKACDVRAPARGGKAAAFDEEIDFGDAHCAAMAEELNNTGDGIGAIESAFCAVDDFDLVNIIERLIRKIEEAARFIEGRPVDEELGEIGVAAIEEKSGETAFAAGARDGRSGRVCSASAIETSWRRRISSCVTMSTGAGVWLSSRGCVLAVTTTFFGDLCDFEFDVESAGVCVGERK